jgi:hypothetical protein
MQEKLHKITIRDYGIYSRTGKLFSLKKYGIDLNNIYDLNTRVEIGLTGKSEDVENEFGKLILKFGVLKLQILLDALVDIMLLEKEQKAYCELLSKTPDTSKSQYYIDILFESSQIKIESIEDVTKIKHEIERLNDKYAEKYPENKKKDGVTFMQVVFAVFKANNQDRVDYEMTLSEFFEYKEMIKTK